MNKVTQLLLLIFFINIPLSINANEDKNKTKRDDPKYLINAVPEVNGKIVFSKEYKIAGMSKIDIFNRIHNWMGKNLDAMKNEKSRIAYSNKDEGVIAGMAEQWIVFSSTALSLDRTLIDYQLTAYCSTGYCKLTLSKIRYTYEEKEHYVAENWISDKYALNKKKTKIVPGLAKWRINTIDLANDTFIDAAVALGAKETRPEKIAEEKKANEEKIIDTNPSGPIIIQNKEVNTTTITQPSISSTGYTTIDLKHIPGNIYALMGNSKIEIYISKTKAIVANTGCALGFQAGNPVTYCSLSADQPSKDMGEAKTYTLKLFEEGHSEPTAIIKCSQLKDQVIESKETRTYVGKINEILFKE